MKRALRLARWLPAIVLGLILADHSLDLGRGFEQYVPDVPATLRRALESDDDLQLARVAEKAGPTEVHRVVLRLRNSIRLDSKAAYQRSLADLSPPILRLSQQLALAFDLPGELEESRLLLRRPYESALAMNQLTAAAGAALADTSRTPAEQLASIDRALAEAGRLDLSIERAALLGLRAQVQDERGSIEGELGDLRGALEASRARGTTMLTMSLFNTFAYVQGKAGRVDSMLAGHEAALAESRRRGLGAEAGRSLRMLASYYRSQGRVALAHSLLLLALEDLRPARAGEEELSEFLRVIDQHARFGAWDLVERELVQADLIARQLPPPARPDRVLSRYLLDRLHARLDLARGRPDRAWSRYPQIRAEAERVPSREILPRFLLEWGQALSANGRCSEAIARLEEAGRLAQRRVLPAMEPALCIARAQALAGVGRAAEARVELDDFAARSRSGELADREGWLDHDALRIRLGLDAGDRAAAERAAAEALHRLDRIAAQLEPGIEGYYFLARSREVGSAIHALLQDDPEASYALEMRLRLLPRVLGRGVRADGYGGDGVPRLPSGRLREDLQTYAHALSLRLARAHQVHLLYRIEDGRVIRWYCDAHGLRREILSGDGFRLRDLLATARLSLVAGSLAPSDGREWRELAGLLLPPELRAGSAADSAAGVLVSAGGELEQLPFEMLDVGAGPPYAPLGARHDVAYLRYDDPPSRPERTGAALVLAEPELPADVLRRHPGLTALPLSAGEAREVAAQQPGAYLLSGARATKPALVDGWARASRIYLVTPAVRDAEVPYRVFLPLAQRPGSTDRSDVSLELEDIRRADLRGCAMVLLVSCDSESPCDDRDAMGPSLAEGFLDAGAAAVVEPLLPVSDAETRGCMHRFAQQWRAGVPCAQALNRARREAWGARPSTGAAAGWGSYVVELASIPPP